MKKPNFFIVGAPKCGTTSLYHYLRQHPQIFMPPDYMKEPCFFGSDTPHPYKPNEKDYLSYFSTAEDALRIGEATVTYLVSQNAAKEIREFCDDDTKILIMLRNPVDVMHSLHAQYIYNGHEHILDFAEALDSEADESRWGYAKATYREMVKFTEQVERYYNTLGRDNVKVIIFDDFIKDTPSVYKETLQFLGVNDNFQPDFKAYNPGKAVRSNFLRNIYQFEGARKIARLFLSHKWRALIMAKFRIWNTRFYKRGPLDPNIRKQLTLEMAPEVKKLSELLNRDLSAWSQA